MSSTIDIRDLEMNALLEVTQAINNNLSEADLYRIYKFTLLGDLKVRKMALFVEKENWSCVVSFGATKHWDGVSLDARFLSTEHVMPLPYDDSDYSDFDTVIPVHHKNRLLAVVFVGEEMDSQKNTTFLQALTNIILVAVENKFLARKQLEQEAYRKELEIAKKVQNFLFPKTLPKSQRLKIEALYLPHHDVGGDYYDYITIDNDRFLICVADVSGKGVPAALLMSNFQASLRVLTRKTQDVKEIVRELNYTIFNSGNGENFITFFLAVYDFDQCSFEYINCGHNPQYLKVKDNITELSSGTTVLGMFHPLPFLESVVIDNLKDFFFFGYTDGLTETFNSKSEEFGEERLLGMIRERNAGIQLDGLHQDILDRLECFKGEEPYRDDITMLTCQVSH